MHQSSSPSTAATGVPPPGSVANPLPPRGLSASNGLAPTDSGAVASAELTHYLSEDHNRLAQDINDVVIRRIFGAGLDLQAALGLIGEHRAANKIWHAIGELDQVIRDIRNIIFDGNQATHGPDANGTPG
jgi:signal transduction histidine kinase